MNVEELRVGNIVNFETIYYKVDTVTASGKLVVTAIKKEWKPEPTVITELKGIELTPEILKQLGFEPLNKAMPHLWTKHVGGYRYIRYHDEVRYMEFEHMNVFTRIPWPVKYVHQMQNACKDYNLNIEKIFTNIR